MMDHFSNFKLTSKLIGTQNILYLEGFLITHAVYFDCLLMLVLNLAAALNFLILQQTVFGPKSGIEFKIIANHTLNIRG